MRVLTLSLLVFFSSFVALVFPAAGPVSVLVNPPHRVLPPPPVRGVRPQSRPGQGHTRVKALGLPSDASPMDSCPPEAIEEFGEEYFKVFGDDCYMFMTHKKVYYENAWSTCWKYGGYIAMPKTQELLKFLMDELTNTFNVNGPVWIGMTDAVDEGTMRWADYSPVEIENFDTYNHGWFGETEDCVALDTRDGLFHDYPCNGIFGMGKKPFVCQFGKEHLEWFEYMPYWDRPNYY